jgi:DNA topoisomerase-1
MPKTTTKERPWRRIGSPEEGFHYLRGDGAPLKSKAALERIRKLVIPPAWTGVEISPDPAAKVQVTGIDKAGRKQYRYNAEFTAKRSKSKYRKLLDLARCIPHLREVTDEHLGREGVGRERVLATVVRLMMRGAFRVGSERYATENKTFGLATLRKSHLRIEGDNLVFRYRGKKAVHQRQVVADTPLVEVIREILELPGPRLFKFRGEDGKTYPVTAREVNDYIKEIVGKRFTSKDLRTWGGTVRAATVLAELGPPRNATEAKKNTLLACKLVSADLGNTPAVCRSSYIHPAVFERYERGQTIAPLMRNAVRPGEESLPGRYYAEEAALMRFLERRS